MTNGEQRSPGVFDSFRRLGDTALGALQNRIELLAVEIAEEKRWLVSTLIWTVASIFFVGIALLTITATVVAFCPAEARPFILLGFSIVIMLAGLSNIPNEVYDAAKVDGAGEWTLLRRITLPLLSPTLFFLSVVSVIGAFQSFGSIYTMTDPNHGGPLGTTRNATMYIFLNFFEFQRLGYASAVAFILFFIVLILTIIQLRVIGPRVHYQ